MRLLNPKPESQIRISNPEFRIRNPPLQIAEEFRKQFPISEEGTLLQQGEVTHPTSPCKFTPHPPNKVTS